MSTGAEKSNQSNTSQVPTLTEKSSGINYEQNSIQNYENGLGERPAGTKNDESRASSARG